MGVADYAWFYPASFRRRCSCGLTTSVSLPTEQDGVVAAKNPSGSLLFTLESAKDGGFRMLDSNGHMVMETRPAGDGEVSIEDRTGREVTRLKNESFTWEGNTYVWKTKRLNFKSTKFTLKQSGVGVRHRWLATLKLPTDPSADTAELEAAPIPDTVPLGVLIFQALIMEHQWNSLQVKLMPFKKLAFSTKWL